MLDFLGVNFLTIIYNLWLLTTKIMIGDKKKSHRYIVFFIHQNLDISECRIQVPQVNFVREFGIHFSSFIPLLCRNLKMFPDFSRSQGGTRPRSACQRGSVPPVPIYGMYSSNAYFDYLYFGSLVFPKKIDIGFSETEPTKY